MVSSIMIKNNSNDSNHLYVKEDFGFSPGWWFDVVFPIDELIFFKMFF